MIKKLFYMFLIISLTGILFAQDSDINTEISNELGINVFFTENIGKEISVTIYDLDITITGTLAIVYRDSIIVITTIGKQKYFIPKSSIAFVKIKE